MRVSGKHRSSMASDLAMAIVRNELTLVYQCIVDLTTHQIIACEALLRWRRLNYGFVSPSVFIPIAEESGLIVPIGKWVLREASKAATRWPRHMSVAVNVSPSQLDAPGMDEEIAGIVASAGLSLDRLELEIIESSQICNNSVACGTLRKLRERGVHIVIDDFGTGYSSMARIRDLPVDRLKLDKSFVSGLNGESADKASSIISSMVYLGKMIDIAITAEGVENAAELELLRKLDCGSAQGFLLAEPMCETELLNFFCSNDVAREEALHTAASPEVVH